MYERAAERLSEAGYVQYEISNWAKGGDSVGASDLPTFACRHNVQYWRNLPYLGIGAGAHGCALGWRYSNVLSPRRYVDRIRLAPPGQPPCSPAVAERTRLDQPTAMDETMLLGFRLTREGIGSAPLLERGG